ncbi:MAG: hypothetical protein ABGY96_20655 [bacterium]|nr:hypothetical protein [Gammaproteobacteria bacterium]HIL96353.1 hypothetical protein [Pseudomonadales bacterium]
MKKLSVFLAVTLFFPPFIFAAEYPDMVGVWKGHVRVISSGQNVSDQVASGGAVLSQVDLKVTIDHQDGESFIGSSRSSNTPKNQPSTPVWGAIRSTGKEALFISANGGRGNLWFGANGVFEFCVTNLNETVISAYCGMLKKQ